MHYENEKIEPEEVPENTIQNDLYHTSGRYQHRLLIVLLVALAGVFVYHFLHNNLFVDNGLTIEKNHAVELDFKINPNTASWQQLAQLPGIGPQKANDIVRYREQYIVSGTVMVFQDPHDLTRINGISTKTVAAIDEYLIFE